MAAPVSIAARPRARSTRGSSSIPPWCLSARTVATSTTALGRSPPTRQTMSKNFSIAHVRAEAGLGDHVVAELQADQVGDERGVAVGDVRERAACIRHGWPSSVWIRLGLIASLSSTVIAPAAPRSSAVTGLPPSKECATVIAPEPPAQVVQVARHGEDRHHLGGRGDVEAGLARVAVGAAAEAEVIWRSARSFMSIARRQPTRSASMCMRVAVQDRGVEHRGEQVVGGADGVDVAGEVEVEVLHRHDLGQAAAGGAALDAEHRPERRLAQAQHRALADVRRGPA